LLRHLDFVRHSGFDIGHLRFSLLAVPALIFLAPIVTRRHPALETFKDVDALIRPRRPSREGCFLATVVNDSARTDQAFTGFGPSRILPAVEWACGQLERARDNRGTRQLIRQHCPAVPGVYGMIDHDGQLIYVGKSKCLPERLQTYFQTSRDSKARRIAGQARLIVWEAGPHEFVALCRELELIRRHRPRFNVRGRTDRLRRIYLCVGRGPAPHAYLADKPPAAGKVFGPLASSRRLHEATRRLNHLFRLRDCPQQVEIYFSDQLELFPQAREPQCMRFDLGTCLAPCAAACDASQYAAEVARMTSFLSGGDATLLDELEQQMLAASRENHFERAATLRDNWLDLKWLRERLELRERMHKLKSFVYPLEDPQGARWWYLFHGGCVAAIVPVPHNRTTARRALAKLTRLYEATEKPEAIEDLSFLLMVAGWFRQNPDQWRRTLSSRQARRRCEKLLVD
jgi:excinuclease ABC subunit C